MELWYVILIFLAHATYGSEDVCPEKCFCNKHLTSVNCEGRQFTAIPAKLPKSVEKIFMGNNLLYHVNFTENGVLPHLQEIRLNNNKISGLKSSTFDGKILPKLSTLYINNNKISVIESRSFFNLSLLEKVYLMNNVIQKIQPDAFVGTYSVSYINLDSNSLSSIPPLGNLKNLQGLYISANQLTDATFPSEYRDLVLVTEIGLSNNNLRKLDNSTFENLQNANVRKVELSRSKIEDISKGAFRWFKNIQSLKLGYNPLTSSDLETAFYGLVGTSLASLNIDNITLDGNLPSSTFQLLRNTSIKTLSMKNNKLTNIPPKGFADLKKLLTLDISAGGIFTISNTAFDGLVALTTLFLNDNQLYSIPSNLPSSLQKLYLNGNQITKLTKNGFAKLSNLQWLYLGGNKIHILESDAFYGLVSLKKLHLVGNIISNLPGNIFSPFTVLQSLELNKNNIKKIPNDQSFFASMSSLLYLNMAGNQLTGCPLGLFSVLPSLQYLHLENNQLGEQIAGDINGQMFAGMEKLMILNLTDNQITVLPDPLFKDLVRVQNLTLNRNKISTWGDNLFRRTASLQNLDLSRNMIALVNSSSVKDIFKVKTLDLRQNPFSCTCDLRWFRDWINKTMVKLVGNDTYVCNSPPDWHGKKLLTFDRTKINCLWFTETDIILAGVGGFVVLLVCIGIVYKKRWFIRLRCYRIYRYYTKSSARRYDGYQIIDGEVNKYDAYISSSNDDYQWVIENLMPGIDNGSKENEEFGGEFKLYFEDRDAQPGAWEMESILDNMEASRVVLIVLTKKYISQARYEFEIVTALDLMVRRKISDILVINVDGLQPKHVPRLLRRKMERHDFIAWEDSEEAKLTFKEQLADGLKRKRKIENVI